MAKQTQTKCAQLFTVSLCVIVKVGNHTNSQSQELTVESYAAIKKDEEDGYELIWTHSKNIFRVSSTLRRMRLRLY